MPATDAKSPTKVANAPAEPVVSAVRPFGKYFLVRKLAEGGMAEIFLAKQVGAEGFERNVVIKRMLQHLTQISDFVKMFLDEARLAARLSHPNIVQINDLGLADGCYYICMEYLPGEDFSALLRSAARRREYVPLNVVARVVADAAHGLHFAHEFKDEEGKALNIVHRDVSPSNIFVTYQGQVKMLDFGIAKAESRVTNTTAGVVKGKYMYMCPEQARGQPVDCRADVFSLGVSLYEACTNTRPFSKDNDLAVLNAVLRCEYTPPRRVRPDLPPELEAIILRAMSPDPNARFQSAQEMAVELEHFVTSSSSATGGLQVSAYVQNLIGQERVTSRMRIQTLAAMAASGVDVPGFSNPYSPRTQAQDSPPAKEPEGATRMVGTPPSVVAAVRRKRRTRRMLVGAVVAVLLGGGAAVWRSIQPPLEQVGKEDPVMAPEKQPQRPQPPVATADAGMIVTKDREPPPPLPPPPPNKPPVRLTSKDIQGKLSAYQAQVYPCFVQHRGDLSTEQGQIPFGLTILSSGKVVNAKVTGPLAGTGVGGCVERKIANIKFPRHLDKEISLNTGYTYQLK
ncbi:MAG: protein kinase domain-containing protein [Myxococcaceae bacterium]